MADTIDLFQTRVMLSILEQMLPVRTFFFDRFFDGQSPRVSNTEHIDIDVVKGNRRMAPFVNPKLEGKVVERDGYTTFSYKPAYIKPKMITTAEDILKRQAGEVIYGATSTPSTRAAEQLAQDMAELDRMITRRIEWMCAKALTTGKIPVQGDGVDDEVDFLMSSDNIITLSGSALWTDHTDSDPLQNLKAWKRQVSKQSGLVVTDAVFGADAMDNFLKCDNVLGANNLFDMRNVNIGRIEPRVMADMGVTYYGTITEIGLDLWTYEEYFYNEVTKTTDDMMPKDKVLLLAAGARREMHYGAIKDLSAIAPVPRFPKSWITEDPSSRLLMVQSSPLPAPHQIDGQLVAKVV